MKSLGSILICGLVGLLGCGCAVPLGEPLDDPGQTAALLDRFSSPPGCGGVFRTVIRWGSREISLVEIVKPLPDGRLSVAGMTDLGNTLYAVRIDDRGRAEVVSKFLPFSDRWLLDGLVAELLIPWKGPEKAGRWYRLPDGTRALVHEEDREARMYLFDAADQWREFRRLSAGRVRSRVLLEWDGGPLPSVMRVDNIARHYQAVRERVSSD